MKLFVDTGNFRDIEALAQLGILDGVTNNPSLLAKESGDYRHILKQICQTVKGPVSAEVVATDTAGMIREGRDLARTRCCCHVGGDREGASLTGVDGDGVTDHCLVVRIQHARDTNLVARLVEKDN